MTTYANKQDAINELEKALRICQTKNSEYQKQAESYLPLIRKTIEKASNQLENVRTSLRKIKVQDDGILNNIDNQYKDIVSRFSLIESKIRTNLNNKKKDKATFNITLFGRSMVGKSTLMEILTHGSGKSIGNGSQRTTRDVREYNWNGLTIVDVPGINAFKGKEDEVIAAEAARKADLIIFLINDDQPESIEAEWLVKLKKEDKPLLCVCNCKSALNDSINRKMFLAAPEQYVMNKQRLQEITNQFNAFVQKILPNEVIDIINVQLLAEFLSMRPEHSCIKNELHRASNMAALEKRIIIQIAGYGAFYKEKSYLTLIDNPMYRISRAFMHFSEQNIRHVVSISEKEKNFKEWKDEFISREDQNLNDCIETLFNRIYNGIGNFVDDNVENEDFADEWEWYIDSFNVQEHVENKLSQIAKKAITEIQSYYAELGTEIQFTNRAKASTNWRPDNIFNTKRAWGWSSAVLGACALIPGVGVIALVGSGICAFFSWLSDSREEKLRARKRDAVDKLEDSVSKMEQQVLENAEDAFYDEIVGNIIGNADDNFSVYSASMFSLTNSQRMVAFEYNKLHKSTSTRLITNAFKNIGMSKASIDSIISVARIPGKHILIHLKNNLKEAIPLAELYKTLGSQEQVTTVVFNNNNLNDNIKTLLNTLKLKIDFKIISFRATNLTQRQDIVTVSYKKYEAKELETLELMEQLLNIQILKKIR